MHSLILTVITFLLHDTLRAGVVRATAVCLFVCLSIKLVVCVKVLSPLVVPITLVFCYQTALQN